MQNHRINQFSISLPQQTLQHFHLKGSIARFDVKLEWPNPLSLLRLQINFLTLSIATSLKSHHQSQRLFQRRINDVRASSKIV